MNWKMNPRTGHMEPTISPSKEIEKALIPVREEPKWFGMRTARDGVKIINNSQFYLAISFQGKWRLLGLINNMGVIEKHLREPLVNFHNAWLKGLPINEPKIN